MTTASPLKPDKGFSTSKIFIVPSDLEDIAKSEKLSVGDRTQPLFEELPTVAMDETSVYRGVLGRVATWMNAMEFNRFGRRVVIIVGCSVAGRAWIIEAIVDTANT